MVETTPHNFKLINPAIIVALHIAAIAVTLSYGLHHLFNETFSIAVCLLSGSLVAGHSLIRHIAKKPIDTHLAIFAFLICLDLLITSYYYHYRGLVFLFPFIGCLFYFSTYKKALAISLTLTTLCLAAATQSTTIDVVLRFAIGLYFSILFSAIYANIVNKQQLMLKKDAHEDSLTGITNRRYFNDWLDSTVKENRKNKKNIALFYIDIDDFKTVNDSLGHIAGDELLKAFSQRILTLIRHNELVIGPNKVVNFARLAGDEFIIAIVDIENIQAAKNIAQRLIDSARDPFDLKGFNTSINMSIGVMYSENNMSAEMLIHNADTAMYEAKKNGKNNFYLYDDSIINELQRRKDIETHINDALKNDLFKLEYMPIYNLQDNNEIVGVETLIRCKEAYLEKIGPEKFIAIAESSGQIKEIDLWVLEKTFKKINENKEILSNIWHAINISSTELLDAKFIEKIQQLLKHYSIDARNVHLEITETKLVPYESIIISRLNQLRELNFHLTLDDFGTGYTGFAQLINFPGSYIKIDKSFISEINNQCSKHMQMIDIMISIAKIYGLEVIAEGVENTRQADHLKKLGCQYAQGHFYSTAIDWDTLHQLLQQR